LASFRRNFVCSLIVLSASTSDNEQLLDHHIKTLNIIRNLH